MKSINILLLVLCGSLAFAQTDTTAVTPADTAKSKWYIPTGVRIGTDALSIARTYYSKSFKGWEVNGDVDFGRYYLSADYGYWARDYASDKGIYDNSGNYFRVGVDVNFLLKDPEKNMFFIGARYGRATFSEHLVVEGIEDPVWGTLNEDLQNVNINGHWFELTTGIKVKMLKWFWMGYTARFKFGLGTNETGRLVPADVPGYGRTDKESVWGFNYQLFFRIPVRKSPAIITEKDKK